MRVGILGGTFDPPHVGHQLAAVDACERLQLDRLLLVPTSRQPLKAAAEQADPAHRLAMVRLLAEGMPGWCVEDREVRAGGVSYTIDLVRAIRAGDPAATLVLLLGADAASLLPQWREPAAIAELAEIVVLEREGVTLPPLPVPVTRLPGRRVDVSATEVRARVRGGHPIRGFVPDAVAAYIAAHGLYR